MEIEKNRMVAFLPTDNLPRCPKCGEVHYMRIGCRDMSFVIKCKCHDNFQGTGKPCPAHEWATKRNEEIKAEERAEAALNSVLHVPLDEWKDRGKKIRTERYRMEGRIK